jgi:hypothetical protein
VGDFGFNNIKQLTGGGARISNTPGEFSYTAPEMMRSVGPPRRLQQFSDIPAFSHPHAQDNIAS